MADFSKVWSHQISRRSLLERAAGIAGAAAVLSAAATYPAQAAKLPQKAVNYQGSPRNGQQCSNCKLFQAPSSCKSVDGAVSPNGWCAIYQKA